MNEIKRPKSILLLVLGALGVGCGVSELSSQLSLPQKNLSASHTWEECNAQATGRAINLGQKVPTKIIYHYGQPSILAKDVAHHQVPLEDWNQYIMGSATRFSLKPYRRGLYGTEFPEDADQFASEKYSGLIAIEIKDECLKADRVVSLIDLPMQKKFIRWYESAHPGSSVKEWGTQCFSAEGMPRSDQFQFYESPNPEETACEAVVHQFLDQNKIALVQDHLITRSWLIKDRDCISTIEGSPEYWTVALAKNSEIWRNSCDAYQTHRSRARVWFNALSEKLEALPSGFSFDKLLAGVPSPYVHGADEFAVQDFSVAFDQALGRCLLLNRASEFKSELKELASNLEGMDSDEVKSQLGQSCR